AANRCADARTADNLPGSALTFARPLHVDVTRRYRIRATVHVKGVEHEGDAIPAFHGRRMIHANDLERGHGAAWHDDQPACVDGIVDDPLYVHAGLSVIGVNRLRRANRDRSARGHDVLSGGGGDWNG